MAIVKWRCAVCKLWFPSETEDQRRTAIAHVQEQHPRLAGQPVQDKDVNHSEDRWADDGGANP